MKKLGLLLMAVAIAQFTFGQNASDIYVADLGIVQGQFDVSNITNITKRTDGYDNQPSFTSDGNSILFSSIRKNGQADIHWYSFTWEEVHPVTRTGSSSEYSPIEMVGTDYVSVVKQEMDGRQRLWKIPLKGGTSSVLLENYNNIGYYSWIDANRVALWLVGDEPIIEIVDIATGVGSPITGVAGIGKNLKPVPNSQNISFVLDLGGKRYIVSYNPNTKEMNKIVDAIGENDEFVWSSDGSIFMGNGARIYKYTPKIDESWVVMADMGSSGISNVTRIDISPSNDKISFVNDYGTTANTYGQKAQAAVPTATAQGGTMLTNNQGKVVVNDVMKVDFTLDEKGNFVKINHDIAYTLKSVGSITPDLLVADKAYTFKDGTTLGSERFKLKSIEIGGRKIENVECYIDDNMSEPMIIGLKALNKYTTVVKNGNQLMVP